jgi:hypothetical protein
MLEQDLLPAAPGTGLIAVVVLCICIRGSWFVYLSKVSRS